MSPNVFLSAKIENQWTNSFFISTQATSARLLWREKTKNYEVNSRNDI